jgi:carbon monoxide dehydrogenase subunit G
MQFTARHDLDASSVDVFESLGDTAKWERAALRRGVEVLRRDSAKGLVVGAGWAVKASFRGKPRDIDVTLTEVERPRKIAFKGMAGLFSGDVTLDLIELSARRTRVNIAVEITPNTLAARIMLQSMRLARGRMQKRFAQRVRQTFNEMNERLAKA